MQEKQPLPRLGQKESMQHIADARHAAGLEPTDSTLTPNVDFAGKDLDCLDLRSEALWCPTFTGSNLRYADLSNSYLPYAEFIGANLEDALLVGANIPHGQFKDAKMKNVNLVGASLFEAILSGADLRGALLAWTDLQDVIVDRRTKVLPEQLALARNVPDELRRVALAYAERIAARLGTRLASLPTPPNATHTESKPRRAEKVSHATQRMSAPRIRDALDGDLRKRGVHPEVVDDYLSVQATTPNCFKIGTLHEVTDAPGFYEQINDLLEQSGKHGTFKAERLNAWNCQVSARTAEDLVRGINAALIDRQSALHLRSKTRK